MSKTCSLIVGLARYMHKPFKIRLEHITWILKITDEDKEKNFRVLGCSGNLDEWISCAKAVHLADPFDKIVSFDDEDIVKASIISEVLNVDFFPPNLVKTISDKYLMRQVLRSKGIDDTASFVIVELLTLEKYRYLSSSTNIN